MNLFRRRLEIPSDAKDALLKQLVYAPCVHCGGVHDRACPRPKSLTFSADGRTPVGVEFWPRRKWDPWPRYWPWSKGPRNGVLYLSDIFEEGDEIPTLTDEEKILESTGMNPLLFLLREWSKAGAIAQRAAGRG